MRIYDVENNKTLTDVELYLTLSEAAELLGFLYTMINEHNVKSGFVSDKKLEHNLKVYIYNQFEQSGFNSRQKMIIEQDS